jgi:hypothetical protein
MQVTVVHAMTLLWSDATGRFPMGTPLVVIIVTPVSFLLIVGRVHFRCCVQHRMEALNMHIDILIILL